jgi:hypothetical protein
LRNRQKSYGKPHKTLNLPSLLNKTKKYKKLLLKSEIIANILNVVRASEKSLPDRPAKLTAKARRLIYKKFSTYQKIASAERRFAAWSKISFGKRFPRAKAERIRTYANCYEIGGSCSK